MSDELTVQKYELQFAGGHCNNLVLVEVNSTPSAPDVMSFPVSDEPQLNKGANYTVRLRAVNAFTAGGWSQSVPVQIQGTSKFNMYSRSKHNHMTNHLSSLRMLILISERVVLCSSS